MELKVPEFGDKLDNGATVISYTHIHSGGNGYKPHGTVLAHWSHRDQFVTWNVYYDGGQWHAEHGHYFTSVIEATEDYKDRVGV